MQIHLSPTAGTESYIIHSSGTVSYRWCSKCGNLHFETLAYNLEAARAKAARWLKSQSLEDQLPVSA